MIRYLWKTFNFFIFKVNSARLLNPIEMKILNLEKQRTVLDNRINRQIALLNKAKEEFDFESKQTDQLLKEAKQLNDKMAEALDATREQLKTAEDIIIPGLVAANKMFIDRWDAESAIQARRKHMNTPVVNED